MKKRPTVITVVCVIGFAAFAVNVFYVSSLYPLMTATYGDWYGPVWVISLGLTVTALIGYWMMKRWGVFLYAGGFLVGTIVGLVSGIPFTLIGVLVPTGISLVGFVNFKKMT